jgi:HD-GYP domain-containing protein (c-di-GMP phosphodiesterase class II)
MTIRMDSLIRTIGTALDIVEGELLGVSTNHGKRVAVLCSAMSARLGMTPRERPEFTACALFHDNALTEYILSEREGGEKDPAMKSHCVLGQRNIDALGLAGTDGLILYHHERADGSGPFGKRPGEIPGEIPLEAELIGIADKTDAAHHLQRLGPEELTIIRSEIRNEAGVKFSPQVSGALLDVLDADMLTLLSDAHIQATVEDYLPAWTVDIEDHMVIKLGELITRFIDYKSAFTKRHSTEIAAKAALMADWYAYNAEQRAELFLTACLHDLGKVTIPAEILEKPGKLTDAEFEIIKSHVYRTWEFLKDIEGMEHICTWAANHHEKLDGTGYPFSKTADQLDFNSRLMACIDIYQAVSEERPYHPPRTHEDTMTVLQTMAHQGLIDPAICADLAQGFKQITDNN